MVRGVEQNRTPFSSPIRPVSAVRNVRQSASISQDTVSRHPLASDAPPPRDARSPLKIVIDCFFCIKSILLHQLQKILSLFFKTSPASREDQQQDPQPLLTEPRESFEEDDFSPPLMHSLGARLHTISEEDSIETGPKLSDLEITEEEKEHITFIISTLAKNNAFTMPTFELRRRGKELNHLHPFLYLKYAICNEELFVDFQTMKTRSFGFIWSQYASEFCEKLSELHQRDVLMPYLRSFAIDTGRDYEKMREMISTRNFLAFTDYLVETPEVPSSPVSSNQSSKSSSSNSSQTPQRSPRKRQDPSPAHNPISQQPLAEPSLPLLLHSRDSTIQRQRSIRRKSKEPSTPTRNTAPLFPGSDRPFARESSSERPFAREVSFDPTLLRKTTSEYEQADIQARGAESLSTSGNGLSPLAIPMPDFHKQKLSKIFEDVAHGSSWTLVLQITSLKSDWEKLKEIHPLRLLCEVFNTPEHLANLAQILQSKLRKEFFLTDFALTLQAGATKDQLIPYMGEFFRIMNIQDTAISTNILVGGEWDWKHVIKYLFTIKQLEASTGYRL